MSAAGDDRGFLRGSLGLGGRALVVIAIIVGFAGAAATGEPGSPTPETIYAAVFDGDGTGATDVTRQLKVFLESHEGAHVALQPGATYLVRALEFTARDLTLDFRGARIVTDKPGSGASFRLVNGEQVVLNDPTVHGTGFEWQGGDDNPQEWDHGIEVNGGSDVTINRPTTRDTRGDGIYIGYEDGMNQPATGVLIVDPDIQRASRNGIAPVAGEVTILGGTIRDIGLHGIDFEPNNDVGASSIVGVVDGVDIRRTEALDVAGESGYAIAGASRYSFADKPTLLIQNLTGERLDMRIYDTANLTIRNNVSDQDATVYLKRVESVSFDDNVRVSLL